MPRPRRTRTAAPWATDWRTRAERPTPTYKAWRRARWCTRPSRGSHRSYARLLSCVTCKIWITKKLLLFYGFPKVLLSQGSTVGLRRRAGRTFAGGESPRLAHLSTEARLGHGKPASLCDVVRHGLLLVCHRPERRRGEAQQRPKRGPAPQRIAARLLRNFRQG